MITVCVDCTFLAVACNVFIGSGDVLLLHLESCNKRIVDFDGPDGMP